MCDQLLWPSDLIPAGRSAEHCHRAELLTEHFWLLGDILKLHPDVPIDRQAGRAKDSLHLSDRNKTLDSVTGDFVRKDQQLHLAWLHNGGSGEWKQCSVSSKLDSIRLVTFLAGDDHVFWA